jgi:hypothetical protein
MLAVVVKANKAHDDDLMDLVTSTNKQTKQTNKWIMWDLVASTNKQNDYVHLVVVSTNKMMMIICIPVPTRVLVGTDTIRPNFESWGIFLFSIIAPFFFFLRQLGFVGLAYHQGKTI